MRWRLVAYDGQAPELDSDAFGRACGARVAAWLHGDASAELSALYADDWVQGEVTWGEEPGGALQRRLGVVAGMLADAAMERPTSRSLLNDTLARPPLDAAAEAAQAVVDTVKVQGDTVLVSEAQLALSSLEASATSSSSRLKVSIQREMLRLVWTSAGAVPARPLPDEKPLDDAWILEELAQMPQSVRDRAVETPVETLLKETARLDAYLVRLLRLKRALAVLLDEWEKVDYYAILGVPSTASEKELRNAYRKACLRLHPDKGGDKEQFQQLQDAYARILEERSKQDKKAPGEDAKPSAAPPQKAKGAAAAGAATSDGALLALEAGAGSGDAAANGEVPEAAAAVTAAVRQMHDRLEAVGARCREAERIGAQVQQLRQAKEGHMEALASAQEAGEALLRLSSEMAALGPELSEASMEVAECCLELAARFSAVPASMLLTDVALSCTFEASRMKHSASQLQEVRKDTEPSLQTLKTNLGISKILGTVDTETFKLSLGLVGKAASRMLASVRQLASATADALQRGRQCSTHARAVAAFAAGRTAAEEACAEAEPAALPAADEDRAKWPKPEARQPPGEAGDAEESEGAECRDSRPQPPSSHPAAAAARLAAAVEARSQSDRLLRQLNAELLEQQRRCREHLAKQRASAAGPLNAAALEVDAAACGRVFQLVAEVLLAAAEEALAEVGDASSPEALEGAIARSFSFLAAAGGGLASPVDLRAQLLRLAALLDASAVLGAVEVQAKSRIAAWCADDAKLLTALDRRFERLADSVKAAL